LYDPVGTGVSLCEDEIGDVTEFIKDLDAPTLVFIRWLYNPDVFLAMLEWSPFLPRPSLRQL
jgi:hypothetical protein